MGNYFNYTLAYPEGFLSNEGRDLSGIVFYVGKGTNASRMDAHLSEASRGCCCKKCCVIRWIWEKGKHPSRSIVFETPSEQTALINERYLIQETYKSEYLTNVVHHSSHVKLPSGDHGRFCFANKMKPPVFQEGGETYYNVSVSCRFTGVGVVGTRFLFLAAEFGLSKFPRGNVTYYHRSELLKFLDWVNENYPGESVSPRLQDPEMYLPCDGFGCDGS